MNANRIPPPVPVSVREAPALLPVDVDETTVDSVADRVALLMARYGFTESEIDDALARLYLRALRGASA